MGWDLPEEDEVVGVLNVGVEGDLRRNLNREEGQLQELLVGSSGQQGTSEI